MLGEENLPVGFPDYQCALFHHCGASGKTGNYYSVARGLLGTSLFSGFFNFFLVVEILCTSDFSG